MQGRVVAKLPPPIGRQCNITAWVSSSYSWAQRPQSCLSREGVCVSMSRMCTFDTCVKPSCTTLISLSAQQRVGTCVIHMCLVLCAGGGHACQVCQHSQAGSMSSTSMCLRLSACAQHSHGGCVGGRAAAELLYVLLARKECSTKMHRVDCDGEQQGCGQHYLRSTQAAVAQRHEVASTAVVVP